METENGTGYEAPAELEGVPNESAEIPGPDAEVGATPTQQSTGINPAWAPIRDVLGEDLFDVQVAPHLQKFDESANSRITNLSSQLKNFEPFSPFVEQGVNPSDIQSAMEFVQLLESDPQAFYTNLGQYLNPEGEGTPEGLEDHGAGQDGAAEIPPHILSRLEAAEQFQQQFIEQQQTQQQEQEQQAAIEHEGQQLDQAMTAFLGNNPTFTEQDKGELFRIQYELTRGLESRGIQRMASLEEAAEVLQHRFNDYKQRFGGGGAPSTLPTTTGGNIPGSKPDVGKMSKQEMEALVSSDLVNLLSQS